jgi:hypothetical protein
LIASWAPNDFVVLDAGRIIGGILWTPQDRRRFWVFLKEPNMPHDRGYCPDSRTGDDGFQSAVAKLAKHP